MRTAQLPFFVQQKTTAIVTGRDERLSIVKKPDFAARVHCLV